MLFAFTVFSFLPNRNAHGESSASRSLILLWLYPCKQAADHFMLFARLYRVLFSCLECSVEQVLAADPSVHSIGAGRLLIATSMNNFKNPTNTTVTARL